MEALRSGRGRGVEGTDVESEDAKGRREEEEVLREGGRRPSRGDEE